MASGCATYLDSQCCRRRNGPGAATLLGPHLLPLPAIRACDTPRLANGSGSLRIARPHSCPAMLSHSFFAVRHTNIDERSDLDVTRRMRLASARRTYVHFTYARSV